MAGKMTPEQFADKLVRNGGQAVQDYKDGIARVTVAPTASAALHLDKARQNYNAAIDSGKTKRALEKVTLAEWQAKASTVGAMRFADGLSSARPKIVKFAQQFLPYIEDVRNQIGQMPNLTKEDAKQRMLKNFDLMSAFTMT